ncbi:MAG TPA: tetratricopeptide repeat protein [Caldithrix abyssi]|uniref:Tetratricopeptide repeat protein n=1 Tax=Caldithrix abyssi TaxID=187145 RepID=A0A7V1LJR5_CALAY|nr:tetratricopeptide repeat protein [Caldithrix abyssi]
MKSFPISTMAKALLILLLWSAFGQAQGSYNEKVKLSERLMRAGQYASALSTLQSLYREGKITPKVINNISRCYQELNLYDERIAFLEDVVRRKPAVYSYRITLGTAWFLKHEKERALEIWRQVLTQGREDAMRYRLVAQAMYSVRLLDEAIDVYKQALRAFPQQTSFLMDIANLYRAQLNYEQAARYYLAYLRQKPGQYSYIRSMMLNMARDGEHTERLITVIREEDKGRDPRIRELLAYMYMRDGNFEKAFEIVRGIEARTKGKPVFTYLNRFINEAERSKAWPWAIRGYELMLEKTGGVRAAAPTYQLARSHYAYARTLRERSPKKAGDHIEQALRLLESLITSQSHQKVRAALLAGDIHKDYFNDLDEALNYYTRFPVSTGGTGSGDALRLKLADVYLLKNDLKAALTFYASVTSDRYKSFGLWQQAEIAFYQSRFQKAKKLYRSLLGQTGLSDSLSNNILERLFLLNNLNRDSLALSNYAHAALLQRQKKESEAAGEFSQLATTGGPLSRMAATAAIRLYSRLKKYDAAIATAHAWLENNKEDEKADEIFFLLAGLYQKRDEKGRALAVFEIILQKFPYSFYTDEARRQAREISETLNTQKAD